ncbi:hypothetical protein LDC_2295, partial [sediment metagenome]
MPMKLLLDANIPHSFLRHLQDKGYDVTDVRDISAKPLTDDKVFEFSCKERRILITRDLDFGNILHYPPKGTAGIIVLRMYLLPADESFE